MRRKKNAFAQPPVWGPSTWRMLHCVSMTYPSRPTRKHKHDMETFLNSLGNILPCRLCGSNYRAYLKDHPADLRSRDALVRWMIDLHNDVNHRLRKPILSVDEALEKIHSCCRP